MSEKIIRLFHSNGQLRAEFSQGADGRVNGLSRDFHPNGQLAKEATYENGLVNGTMKTWASDGRFLGECTLEHGNGMAKMWHDNGQLWIEVLFANGLPHGRQKTWYEDGEPAPDIYWIRGKQVSRKKYFEASRKDLELPKYSESD